MRSHIITMAQLIVDKTEFVFFYQVCNQESKNGNETDPYIMMTPCEHQCLFSFIGQKHVAEYECRQLNRRNEPDNQN